MILKFLVHLYTNKMKYEVTKLSVNKSFFFFFTKVLIFSGHIVFTNLFCFTIRTAAPHKLCITEERMAARLRELHISNQYSVPADSSSFGPYSNSSNSVIEGKSVTNLQELEAV